MLTSSLLNMVYGSPANENRADMQDALMRYFALKSAEDVGGSVLGRLGFGDSNLQHENLKLDNAIKRATLGLPNDSEDFNDDVNNRHSSILASLGINFEKGLKSPTTTTIRGSLLKPIYRFGHAVEEGIEDVGRSSSGIQPIVRRALLRRS